MTTSSSSGLAPTLGWLAVIQGAAIATLAVLLLGGDDVAPVGPAPSATTPVANAATPAEAGQAGPHREAEPTAAPMVGATVAAATSDVGTGTVLYGRVVSETGEAITEGYVWLSRAGEAKSLATISPSSRDPVFAVAGLAPGEITFRTRATGYRETSGSISIPAATPRLRHDIVLSPAWLLAVKVQTPAGEPLQPALRAAAKDRPMLYAVEVGVIVTATKPAGDFPPTELREITYGLGRWRPADGIDAVRGEKQLPKDVTGIVEIDRKQPVWVSAVLRQRVLASVAVEAGQLEATINLGIEQVLRDLGTIRGRVVDSSGQPLTEVRVGFGDRQSGGMGNKVDAEGRFEVKDLRPGLLTIEIHTKGLMLPRNMVLLAPGQVLDLGDVVMRETRVIKGRCEGVTGKGSDVRIACRPLDPPPHPAMHQDGGYSSSVTDDGSFSLHLVEGRYLVRASAAGGAVTEIDTRTIGDQPLVLQLAKEANVRLDVQSQGEPCELAVFDSRNREIYRRNLRDGWKFALPFLPGDYRVEVTDGRGKVETRRLQVGADGADLRVP
jgi:hypothetical protein